MARRWLVWLGVLGFATVGVACSCEDDPARVQLGGKKDAAVDATDEDADEDPITDANCAADDKACVGDKVQAVLPDGWLPAGDEAEYGGIDQEDGDPGENPWLTLGGSGMGGIKARSAWIANTADGTVSRLDVESGKEVARYVSALQDATYGTPNARVWNQGCTNREPDLEAFSAFLAGFAPAGTGNCPSRTAVNQSFDAYVANRAFDGYSTVTKYANDPGDCIDKNNDNVIQTSHDWDGDGTINTDQGLPAGSTPGSREFWGPDDECVLWTRPAGGVDGVARALAVGRAGAGGIGDVWVGLYGSRKIVRLDGATGAEEAVISLDGDDYMRPYGAATGPDGKIWFVWAGWLFAPNRGLLGYVDPITNEFTKVTEVPSNVSNCMRPYGMTLDPYGRIWIANTACSKEILVYDPATDTWDGLDLPSVKRSVPLGDEGAAECTLDEDTYLCTDGVAMGGSTLQLVPRGMASSYKSIWYSVAYRCPPGLTLNDIVLACAGIDPDFGDAYSAAETCCTNYNPENLVGRIDLETKEVVKLFAMPDGRLPVGIGYSPNQRIWVAGQTSDDVSYADLDENDELTSGWSRQVVGNLPYTYSDFIGFGLNELAAPDGYYRFPVDGCDPNYETTWTGFNFDATQPNGTEITFNVRTADSLEGLDDADWIGPFPATSSPVDLTEPPGPIAPGRFIEIEVLLRTLDGTVKPRIRDIEVLYSCSDKVPT